MDQSNYYAIEIKICSKNGWHTPQEAQAYYGRYDREGITWHWWGDGTGADNHDNIVNYISNGAANGVKSVNYVLSDRKISLLVSPDNVAWCSQSGNPTTISVELQPTLSDEGYKRAGWLAWQLEQRYNRRLSFYPHKKWFATDCPGTIDINRIRAEADKWANGGYQPAPPPKPVPTVPPASAPSINIVYSKLPTPVKYIVNKDTDLWNFNTSTWSGFKSVKKLTKGEEFIVHTIADNVTLHAHYGMTEYSATRGITNGVNMSDLNLAPVVVTPTPPTQPTVPPTIPVPPPTQGDLPKPPTVEENVNWLVKAVKAILAFFKINI
jgi:hypothetical protein